MKRYVVSGLSPLVLFCSLCWADDDPHGQGFLASLSAAPQVTASTVPPNGDLNPYGVAFVPRSFPQDGLIKPGDVLVSNFNSSSNLQGTGTTIVRITPEGVQSVFFSGPAGLGLSTALGVLRQGLVLVGNVPSPQGMCPGVGQGSLIVIDRFGKQVANLTDLTFLNGPWDLTIRDEGDHPQVFVSDVLSGTVTRLDLNIPDSASANYGNLVRSSTQIGSGYTHRCDPNALVVGPTGLALDRSRDLLYVASTADNAIYAIEHAGSIGTKSGQGKLIYSDSSHLRGPLALLIAPNGNLVTTNGDAINANPQQPSEMVEFTPEGKFVNQRPVNSTGTGGAFGIAIHGTGDKVHFAAVDDILNMLAIWTIQ